MERKFQTVGSEVEFDQVDAKVGESQIIGSSCETGLARRRERGQNKRGFGGEKGACWPKLRRVTEMTVLVSENRGKNGSKG